MKRSPPKKTKTKTKKGSSKKKKSSPRFSIKKLPFELQFEVLLKIPPDRINKMCMANKTYLNICYNFGFYSAYSTKWFKHDNIPNKAWFKRAWPKNTKRLTYVYYSKDGKQRHKVVHIKNDYVYDVDCLVEKRFV